MASEYTPPTISNYNDNPAPDDGTEVADNEITWQKIKDELTDPINVYAGAINSAVTTTFTTLGTSDEFDLHTNTTTSIPASTSTAVPFNSAAYATINEYGMYQCNANISIDSVDDGSYISISLYVDPLGVGSPAIRKSGPLVYNQTGGTTVLRIGMSAMIDLDPTDRVYVYTFHNSAGAKTITANTAVNWFNGFRVLGTAG